MDPTQDENGDGEMDENGASNEQQEDPAGQSYSLSHQKSMKSVRAAKTRIAGGNATAGGNNEDEYDEDGDNNAVKFLYKAVGSEKRVIFQATLTPIDLEVIPMSIGYFMRLEVLGGSHASTQNVTG
jgi:hypothetical protein